MILFLTEQQLEVAVLRNGASTYARRNTESGPGAARRRYYCLSSEKTPALFLFFFYSVHAAPPLSPGKLLLD